MTNLCGNLGQGDKESKIREFIEKYQNDKETQIKIRDLA